MFGQFAVVPVESDPEYTVVQPPAGLIRFINNRLKMYSTEGTGDSFTLSNEVWAAIFVFSAVHYNGTPIAVQAAEQFLPSEAEHKDSIRGIFQKMDESNFRTLVEEFLFAINRDKLQELFKAVDSSTLVTKKATDEVKND